MRSKRLQYEIDVLNILQKGLKKKKDNSLNESAKDYFMIEILPKYCEILSQVIRY